MRFDGIDGDVAVKEEVKDKTVGLLCLCIHGGRIFV
jgi:hypothetical protein